MSFFYEWLKSLGTEPKIISYYAIAILLMSVINKLLTVPMTLKQSKSSRKLAELQPKIDEIQKKYGYDEAVLQQKMKELYEETGTNPMGGSCLMMIINMIIIFALYDVIRNPETYIWQNLTEAQIANVSKSFLWIENLQVADSTLIIAFINSATQLLASWLMQKSRPNTGLTQEQASSQNVQMFMMPIMFFFIFKNLPAALVLYWSFGNIIEIILRLILQYTSKNE